MIKFKSYGEEFTGCFEVNRYNNGNLAIDIMLGYGEPFESITVNTNFVLNEDEAAVDTNNFPEAEDIIREYHLGENTGKSIKSGFCEYPVYKFNLSVVNQHTKILR